MSKHFELTDETRAYAGRTLHRIRATRDLPQHGVRRGDLGGWVQFLGNILGEAWAGDESMIMDSASMGGNAIMWDDARMGGNASMGDSGEATSPLHILTATIRTSHQMDATLHRTQGGGHILHVGCESGTLDHHQALCDSDTWIETTGADVIEARPEYQALIDLCRTRVARWNTKKESAS